MLRPSQAAPILWVATALWLCCLAGCNSVQQPDPTQVPTMVLPATIPIASDTPRALPTTAGTDEPTPTLTATEPTVHASNTPSVSPVSLWIAPEVIAPVAQIVADFISRQSQLLTQVDGASLADIRIEPLDLGGTPVATWVFALVAPFSTLVDGVSGEVLRDAWAGRASGPFAGRPLLMSPGTRVAMIAILGEPADGVVLEVAEEQLLARAWADQPAWAIVPFEGLEPRWKVLRVEGLSPLDEGLDLEAYPLVMRYGAAGEGAALDHFLADLATPIMNRDEGRMSVLIMTGVTALTRATAWRMEQKGLTYPAQDIGDWLRSADITHVSNEVSFDPDCGPPNPVQEGLLFCSDPRYIALLEDIGVDVVEMTGNHIADAGAENIEPTLDMYVERGWQYFGGGRELDDARQPAVFHHNGNTIGLLGCNPVGPPSVWATPERAGAAPCDYDLLYAQIGQLRAEGVLPIVTLQYWEEDRYDPTPQQVADFQALIDAGAVIVSGSHAHHAQGFGFYAGGFIHFGLGNLFFDQMELLGNRQEFIDRHVFYDGRHISTELLTALLEDWSRPRPMTEQERLDLLQTVFAVSRW
jgi:hypothetical protein